MFLLPEQDDAPRAKRRLKLACDDGKKWVKVYERVRKELGVAARP